MKRLISLIICCVALVACSGVNSLSVDTNKANAAYSKESGANINYGGNNASATINYKRNSSTAQ